MMNTPGAHRERTPRPAARCNTLDFHGKSCALAEGLVLASRADVYTIRCSCKQWPCTYTVPCVARNLLGRIPNPRICTRWMQAIRAKRGQDPFHQALTSFVVLIFFTRGYAAHRLTGRTNRRAYRCDTDTALFPSGSKPAANPAECGIPGGGYSCLSSCGLCFEVEVPPEWPIC